MASATKAKPTNVTSEKPEDLTGGVNGSQVDDLDDFGDEDVENEAVPASQTAAALSAALPAGARPKRESDGKKALAVRLSPEQFRRVRVKAMVDGVKPADLVASLIDQHVKELKITEA